MSQPTRNLTPSLRATALVVLAVSLAATFGPDEAHAQFRGGATVLIMDTTATQAGTAGADVSPPPPPAESEYRLAEGGLGLVGGPVGYQVPTLNGRGSAQKLLWGTVGVAVSLFCEQRQAAGRPVGDLSARHEGFLRGGRPQGAFKTYHSAGGRFVGHECDACGRVGERAVGAVVEGLFKATSYTKLK